MRRLARKLNERINQLPTEVYKAWFYTLLFIVSLQIDALYCRYLENFYGTPEYYFNHMRGWLAIVISLVFGMVDFYLSKKIMQYASKVRFDIITISINGVFSGIQINGKTKILQYVAHYCYFISIGSILYDCYEVLFVHLPKIGLF